jgi:hypothetical protein
MYFLNKNACKIVKPVEITIRREERQKRRKIERMS